MLDSLQRYPLLRLLMANVAGIMVAHILYPVLESAAVGRVGVLSIAFVLYAAVLLFVAFIARERRSLYGMIIMLLFVSMGAVGYIISRLHTSYPWPSGKVLYEAHLVSDAEHRERNIRCLLHVDAVYESGRWITVDRTIYAYFPLASPQVSDEGSISYHTVGGLQAGDTLLFRARVNPPRNFSDSLPFDYARYLTMQGLSGTVYLPYGSWISVENISPTLREHFLRLRHRLQHKYLYPAFAPDAMGVISALTLGDKTQLSPEVRAAYTDAGAAHALALSGLHVGVIYIMLGFIMRGVVRRRNLRWMADVVIIIVLWAFALMVGMAASVVRAVTMCTIYSMARWVSRDNAPINVLSLTALVMLMVRPFYLFDVGFQLSFMAMASILWLEPHMEMLFQRSSLSRLPAYFVGVVCMSLAAQAGTLPLTLYHFGTFPTWFLVTNLLVVPSLSLLLILCVVWWMFALAGISWATPLGSLLQCLVQSLTSCLAYIASWPCAVLSVKHFSLASTIAAYSLIYAIGQFWTRRNPHSLIYALVALLALLVSMLVA